MVNIKRILMAGIENEASDIHIVEDMEPLFRINRELVSLEGFEKLSNEDVIEIYNYFTGEDIELVESFKTNRRLDLNHEISGNRLRVNIAVANGSPTFTIRIIKNELPQFKDLNLPEIVRRISMLPQGLLLVTGKSNSGKSTTLNALVNEINKTESKKILMLENPVEYVHQSNKSLIIQKEVGRGKDIPTFGEGANNALREDCDILVIGEIRDRSTMDAALEMAESGHMVIGTMHTRSCAESVERVLNFYDLSDQMIVKYLFSSVLKAVVSQRLILGNSGKLVLVPEILLIDEVVAGLIKKEKFNKTELEDVLQTRAEKGNISFISSLAANISRGLISLEHAKKQLDDSGFENLKRMLAQGRNYGNY